MKSFGTEIGKHLSNNCIFIYLTRPIFLYYCPVKKNVFTSVNKKLKILALLYTHPRFWVDAPMVSICKSYFASLLSYHIHAPHPINGVMQIPISILQLKDKIIHADPQVQSQKNVNTEQ